MTRRKPLTVRLVAAIAATALVAGPAFADKPSWAGGGDGSHGKPGREGHEPRYEERQDYRGGVSVDFRFDDRSRGAVHDYYGDSFRHGRCPPGLAKKGNGCLPPGQAKKWQRGYPLPRDVVYYDLPPVLLGRLPPPPPQHRYVRVAGDILLIAIGTSMVIDAIEDIGGR